MVSSIRNFARELGSSHVVKSHAEKQRSHTLKRTATTQEEFRELEAKLEEKLHHHRSHNQRPQISAPFNARKRTVDFDVEQGDVNAERKLHHKTSKNPMIKGMQMLRRVGTNKPKVLLMREEKDRFDAMRKIQQDTHKFKRYSALTMSIIACKSYLTTLTSQKYRLFIPLYFLHCLHTFADYSKSAFSGALAPLVSGEPSKSPKASATSKPSISATSPS